MQLLRQFAAFSLVTVLGFVGTSATAGHKITGKDYMAATLACGGNHDNFSLNNTNYVLRNFNDTEAIQVTSVVVRDANGVVIYDFPNMNPLPANVKTLLGARQSTIIKTTDILASLGNIKRPIMADISWRAANNVNVRPMGIGVVRTTDLGRHTANCRTLSIEKAAD